MNKIISGISYMQLVKMFAFSKGLLFWTTRDMDIAKRLYNEYAERNN